MLNHIRQIIRTIEWRAFALRRGRCPVCGPTLFVRLSFHGFGTRCVICGSARNTMALVSVITRVADLTKLDVHVVSTRGPYYAWLKRSAGSLWSSQYFDDVPPGQHYKGVRCEDLQRLTYPDATFDVVTSSEVLEHVPDDAAAFREIRRVLKPGGLFVFTVPISARAERTVERARREADGTITHILDPEYFGDPVRGRILAFRTYAPDIVQRLTTAGFERAEVIWPEDASGLAPPVLWLSPTPPPTGPCATPILLADTAKRRLLDH